MPARISAERLAIVEKCLDDGWPFIEITRTYGMTWNTINRHFPGRSWTKRDGAKLGYEAMKASSRFRNVNHV